MVLRSVSCRPDDQISGVPNDGFFLNTTLIFLAIQSIFRSLEMNSKWRRYKTGISLVILGETGVTFRNYKCRSIIFSKILEVILSFTKVRIFLIPLSIAFSKPKMLGFLFLRKTLKKIANLGTEMRKFEV